jgi:hypothetical protein
MNKIRIVNITDPEDADLNGLEGARCRRHSSRDPRFPNSWAWGDIGFVGIDATGRVVRANLKHGEYETL